MSLRAKFSFYHVKSVDFKSLKVAYFPINYSQLQRLLVISSVARCAFHVLCRFRSTWMEWYAAERWALGGFKCSNAMPQCPSHGPFDVGKGWWIRIAPLEYHWSLEWLLDNHWNNNTIGLPSVIRFWYFNINHWNTIGIGGSYDANPHVSMGVS